MPNYEQYINKYQNILSNYYNSFLNKTKDYINNPQHIFDKRWNFPNDYDPNYIVSSPIAQQALKEYNDPNTSQTMKNIYSNYFKERGITPPSNYNTYATKSLSKSLYSSNER